MRKLLRKKSATSVVASRVARKVTRASDLVLKVTPIVTLLPTPGCRQGIMQP